MKTEIVSRQEHFGVRWYVKTPFVNNAGATVMLICHPNGFKTRREAMEFARRKGKGI
jgi:hypothetical protein